MQLLKWTPGKYTSGPENIESVQLFPLADSYGGLVKMFTTAVLFCFEFELHFMQPCWLILYTTEERRLVHGVVYTSGTPSSLAYGVMGTECQGQNGSAHSCIFTTFKHEFLTD